jgi:hypothetical protein
LSFRQVGPPAEPVFFSAIAGGKSFVFDGHKQQVKGNRKQVTGNS